MIFLNFYYMIYDVNKLDKRLEDKRLDKIVILYESIKSSRLWRVLIENFLSDAGLQESDSDVGLTGTPRVPLPTVWPAFSHDCHELIDFLSCMLMTIINCKTVTAVPR